MKQSTSKKLAKAMEYLLFGSLAVGILISRFAEVEMWFTISICTIAVTSLAFYIFFDIKSIEK